MDKTCLSNVYREGKIFTSRSIRKEGIRTVRDRTESCVWKKKNAGINQLNYKLVYTSWAKRPPVEDRWSKVGGREKRGLEGGYLVNSTSPDLPPCHPCVDPPFIPPPSFVVIPPLPTKLFTMLLALEGRIIADRLPTFDSMKTFRALGE